MKQLILLLLLLPCCMVSGQVYLDQFDDDNADVAFYGAGLSGEEREGEWTVTADGSGGPFEVFTLALTDGTSPISIDMTENNKIYLRAKSAVNGTQLRLDVKDAEGYVTSLPGITKTLVNDYAELEFDFTGVYQDGGYGGTPCTDGPCDVDGTQIVEFIFFINPGQPNSAATVVMDFVSVGSKPSVGPSSDIFQDQFDDAVSLNYMDSAGPGLSNVVDDGKWIIRGDGTNGMWEPVSMLFYNPATLDTTDVSVADGDDKIYIRMRSDVPTTSVRLDLMDINEFASTAGSVTKIITDEWTTYEYNFAGAYQDLGFGGTGCMVGPCDLDPDRIANMILFVNPGVEGFAGDVEIDYISVGTPLEDDGTTLELAYGDHFSNNTDFVSTTGAYELSVNNSILSITGGGVDEPYSSIAYSLHSEETNAGIVFDATGNNKLFFRAKSNTPGTLIRIDLLDTTEYVTSEAGFTRLLSDEFVTYELDFTNAYVDGGFGGPCENGPCIVDGTAITTALLYPNPADGMFEGTIEIDYISFGAPMGADVPKYNDHFDNEDRQFISDAGGFTVEETGTELILTGDGTAGAYSAFSYTPHDKETGEAQTIDLTSNNKLYIKAKASVANVPFRIDLVDADGFVTTSPDRRVNLTEDYVIYEYDFSGTYTDGGFGGTACDTGPCDVDGTNITSFLFYIDPDNGGYDGTVTLDWFSTIDPLESIVDPNPNDGPKGADEYKDQLTDGMPFFMGSDALAVSSNEGIITITGDGSSGAFEPVGYNLHIGQDSVIVNAVSNQDKVFIRAASSRADLPLRLDLIDNKNLHTSLAGITQLVGTEMNIIEYSFTGNYQDGGYGGTGCDTGPCAVDGERIAQLNFYLDAGVGAFDGTLDIDWISFGEPISVDVVDTDLLESARIFPNPVVETLNLELNSLTSGNIHASFVDISGRTIKAGNVGTAQVGSNYLTIPMADLSPGLYIMNINIDGKRAFFQKLIVE